MSRNVVGSQEMASAFGSAFSFAVRSHRLGSKAFTLIINQYSKKSTTPTPKHRFVLLSAAPLHRIHRAIAEIEKLYLVCIVFVLLSVL